VTQPQETVRLDRAGDAPTEVSRAELLELYRVVIDEYRFQVRFNWDRTQYFFVLSAAMTTGGATVLATLKAWGPLVAIFLFLLGVTTALLGRQLVTTGHEYYRHIVYRKTLLEDLLGRLHKLPGYDYEDAALYLGTTSGMKKTQEIITNPESYLSAPLRSGTITHSLRVIFVAFVAVDLLGFGVAAYQLFSLRP
jgi:hypothetical protein